MGCRDCTGSVSYTHLDVYKRQVQAVAFRIVHAERYRHAAVSGKDDTVFVIDDIPYGISFVCHFLIVCLFFIHSVVICIFAQESNTIIVDVYKRQRIACRMWSVVGKEVL